MLASTVLCLPLFVQAALNDPKDAPQEVYEAAQVDCVSRKTHTFSIAVYSTDQAGTRPTAHLLAGIPADVAGYSMRYGLRFLKRGWLQA